MYFEGCDKVYFYSDEEGTAPFRDFDDGVFLPGLKFEGGIITGLEDRTGLVFLGDMCNTGKTSDIRSYEITYQKKDDKDSRGEPYQEEGWYATKDKEEPIRLHFDVVETAEGGRSRSGRRPLVDALCAGALAAMAAGSGRYERHCLARRHLRFFRHVQL